MSAADVEQWNGEGLPPVGCEVECSFARDDHREFHRGVVELRGISPEGVDMVVVRAADCLACYRSNKHIRPIRSAEDGAVEAMKKAMENFPYDDTKQHLAELVYAAIRAGKVPGVKTEDDA